MTHNKQPEFVDDCTTDGTTRLKDDRMPFDIAFTNDPSEPTVVLHFPGETELEMRQTKVATHYYDSLEWMKTALLKDIKSGRSNLQAPIDFTALKVAQVCCGLAMELAYKALLYAQDKPHSKKMQSHDISKLHDMVDQPDRSEIELFGDGVLRESSSSLVPLNSRDYIKFIADCYTGPDVKYWGKRATARRCDQVVPGIPSRSDNDFGSIVAIQTLHCKILDLARKRTWPHNWEEYQADASQDGEGQYTGIGAVRVSPDMQPTPEWIYEWIEDQIQAALESAGIELPPGVRRVEPKDGR